MKPLIGDPRPRPRGLPLRRLPARAWERQTPTWRAARPGLIDAALKRALARPSGNWYVLAASGEVTGERPWGGTVAGLELVAWRDRAGGVRIGPGACPHLGAPLCTGVVRAGTLFCRWHGLALDGAAEAGWRPRPAHDDGVLIWVRLDEIGGEPPLPAPVLPARPDGARSIDSVVTVTGTCEPADILANRLDPWHGSWFHPYSFADLRVVSAPEEVDPPEDRFLVEVAFRLPGGLGVPVTAEFTCPEPRTIVMRILDGEGVGSVVETHATPLGTDGTGRPRTAVIEAVIATSERAGFRLARRVSPLLRPVMRWAAARLWIDDMAYAVRRHRLRQPARSEAEGPGDGAARSRRP